MIKYIFPFLTIIFIALFFLSCSSKKDQSNAEQNQVPVTEKSSHQTPDSIAGMKLNEGKKWMMDEHTRSSFKKMEASFASSDQGTISGLKNIGGELRGQINDLLKGCTMEGPAHDQLHIFMMGYIPAVDSLSSSDELKIGEGQAVKVKEYLDLYDAYFK